ncbi:MAG TPA: phosphosulfolactate synthase [Gemmatimonadales bacterium]|jgi:phosphosulfolactate synthase
MRAAPIQAAFLKRIGAPDLAPATSPFDPGYDPATLESHLEQSGHLMSRLKLSMACWLIADEAAVRRKLAAARLHGVATVTGGGPFEIAAARGQLPAYFELCAALGVDRVECGAGFTDVVLDPRAIVALARRHGLSVQFELGKKTGGTFGRDTVDALIDQGRRWLDAGAAQLVVEARESAAGIGLFDASGRLSVAFAERFVAAFGIAAVAFEAPTKGSQFALLDHFGHAVQLCNVRLEELLRVEIYRRGLHADAFAKPRLKLPGVVSPIAAAAAG